MTPDRAPARRSRWVWVLQLVAVSIAVIAFVQTRSPGSDGTAASTVRSVPAGAVDVRSNAPDYRSLDDLVAASDLVVRGRVRATERGRWFGDGEEGGVRIQSRLITLEVDDVLAGTLPKGTGNLLLEEEGWTEDDEQLVVDGARPTRKGDAGIWFLVSSGDGTTGAWIVVNAQGRYLDDGAGGLVGAEASDPLVADLSAGSRAELEARISRTRPRP